MRAIALSIVAAAWACASALAQVSFPYAQWADGPVRHLMTKDEVRAWNAVQSNAEAKTFVDLFWARRDPTPDTPRNEYREEFDARVDLADQRFSSAKLRGALSDPGRVLILLGPPWQVATRGPAVSHSSGAPMSPPVNDENEVVVPSPIGELPRQIWTYAHARKPKFIPLDRLVIVFVDRGQNDWELAQTERTNVAGMLSLAVDAWIVSPHLTKAPLFSAPAYPKEFKTAELRKSYDEFKSTGKSTTGPANLTCGEFISADGVPFVAAQLYAPAGSGISAGQALTFFSAILDSAGDVAAIDEQAVTMALSARDSYAQTSLRLDPGDYIATFGLSAPDGRILTAATTPLAVDELNPSAPTVSPMLLSADIHATEVAAAATDPFVFGGLKVVPKGDLVFAAKGDLWYFVEMRKPGLNDRGMPDVKVQVDIAGKTAKGPATMNLPLAAAQITALKGSPGRYAVGAAIPLDGFIPGDYTIKVRLFDEILLKSYDRQQWFRVSP